MQGEFSCVRMCAPWQHPRRGLRIRSSTRDCFEQRENAAATTALFTVRELRPAAGFSLGHAGEGNYPSRDPYDDSVQRRLAADEAKSSSDLRMSIRLNQGELIESKSYVPDRQNRSNSISRKIEVTKVLFIRLKY